MPSGIVKVTKGVSGTIKTGIPIGDKQIFSDTTANWNAQRDLIGKKDCIYVYTDYEINRETGEQIPSMKIGTGNAYLIDLPFVYSGKVTDAMIEFWNNKVSVDENYVQDEILFITKD